MTRDLDGDEDVSPEKLASEYQALLAELGEFVVDEWRSRGSSIRSVFAAHVGEQPPLADLIVALRLDYTRQARTLWSFTFKEFHAAWWDLVREISTMSRREPARKRLHRACVTLGLRVAWLKRLEYFMLVLTKLRRLAEKMLVPISVDGSSQSTKSSPILLGSQVNRAILCMLAAPTLADPLEAPAGLSEMFQLLSTDLLLLASHEGAGNLAAVAFETLGRCDNGADEIEKYFKSYYSAAAHELEPFLLMCRGDLRGLPLRSLALAPRTCFGFPLTSSEAASYTRWVLCARQNSLKPRRRARTACGCGCCGEPRDPTMRKRLSDFVHGALANDLP
jgi:hypothetical protein